MREVESLLSTSLAQPFGCSRFNRLEDLHVSVANEKNVRGLNLG